ncbi:MAG: RidA family protein [Mycobacteriales bacterium]
MRAARDPRNWTSSRPYSPALVADGWAYLSGHVPVDADGATDGADGATQTAAVLRNLDFTLASAGAERDDVVATTVYLTDMADIDSVDAAYRDFFGSSVLPSRTTVEISALGRPEFRVEISAVARVGGGSGAP